MESRVMDLINDPTVTVGLSDVRRIMSSLGVTTESSSSAMLRRRVMGLGDKMEDLPIEGMDYGRVGGRNCDNCIGFVPVPVGVAGPVDIDIINTTGTGPPFTKMSSLSLTIATTEGGLIASVSRGLKSIKQSGSPATVAITSDGMTRCPCLEFGSLREAAVFKGYVEGGGERVVRGAFEGTTKHGKWKGGGVKVVGKMIYWRMEASTGEAMGMNMISKGAEEVLQVLQSDPSCPPFNVVTISGNGCSDKKPSAANFVLGRGKSLTVEATIKKEVVERVLKVTPEDMARTNYYKNQVGSGIAGNLGGSNAHAANVVAGIYLATGQDPAHVVEGSMATTIMEVDGRGDLYVSVTMPCVCVGTVGGGTGLGPQKACIEGMGCKGEGGAKRLAAAVGVGVMAGEISLMASLTEGSLVKAHMTLNRGKGQQSEEGE